MQCSVKVRREKLAERGCTHVKLRNVLRKKSKKPQIMLRTAPNFINIRNKVPAHISRHQTFDIVAVFVGIDKQISHPKKPSLL